MTEASVGPVRCGLAQARFALPKGEIIRQTYLPILGIEASSHPATRELGRIAGAGS
jgi:hypothetical protein